jgi:hypothetical protein
VGGLSADAGLEPGGWGRLLLATGVIVASTVLPLLPSLAALQVLVYSEPLFQAVALEATLSASCLGLIKGMVAGIATAHMAITRTEPEFSNSHPGEIRGRCEVLVSGSS